MALSDEALTVALRVGNDFTVLLALATADVTSAPDRLGQRLADSAEAVALSDRRSQPLGAFLARDFRLAAWAEACHLAEVDRMLDALASIVDDTRLPSLQYVLALHSGWRHILAGHLAEAEATVTRTFELGTRISNPVALAAYAAHLISIRAQQGRPAEVGDLHARAEASWV